MEDLANTAILIMAAGASTRMRSPKQLLPWKNTTLLGHATKQALGCRSGPVYIVLGAHAEEIIRHFDEKEVAIIENSNWQLGLGHSIAHAVTKLEEDHKALEGVLIMLADQPFIDTTHLRNLIPEVPEDFKGIIASDYGNKQGVPAYFSKEWFPRLKQLDGDSGAGRLIKVNTGCVIKIKAAGRIADVDTPEDYRFYSDLNT